MLSMLTLAGLRITWGAPISLREARGGASEGHAQKDFLALETRRPKSSSLELEGRVVGVVAEDETFERQGPTE